MLMGYSMDQILVVYSETSISTTAALIPGMVFIVCVGWGAYFLYRFSLWALTILDMIVDLVVRKLSKRLATQVNSDCPK